MLTLPVDVVRLPSRQFEGPQPASVLRVTGGDLYVEIDAAPGLQVGPCAWSKPVGATDPTTGTRCLVLFAGDGITDPWVVGWSGWPA